MNIGGKIKKLRTERKLSMRELAEQLGITHAHISKLESEKSSPSVDLLQTIADYFSVDISYFFIKQSDLDGFTDNERDLLMEKDLSLESIKEKYNLKIDGRTATDEEIEKVIEYVRALRIINQNKTPKR